MGRSIQLKYTLKDWRTALLVLIYKKGDQNTPSLYGPFVLLSQVRKVIKSAITGTIRKHYNFSEAQLVLRSGAGAETPIARYIGSCRKLRLTAILDLK